MADLTKPLAELEEKWKSGEYAEKLRQDWNDGSESAGKILDALLDCAEELHAVRAQVDEAIAARERLAVAAAIRKITDELNRRGHDRAIGIIDEITDSDSALDTHDAEVHHKGACWMLEAIVGTLVGYPDMGGDIRVMAEVDRLRAESRNQALEEAAVLSDDVATVRGEPNYKVLAAAIRALKTGGSK